MTLKMSLKMTQKVTLKMTLKMTSQATPQETMPANAFGNVLLPKSLVGVVSVKLRKKR